MPMQRRDFFAAMAAPLAAAVRPLPNIIFIYADDLGWGDLGCYGNPLIRTPNLDRMAAEGMRFTQFYSAAPLCSPSRAALLTGRYPIRSGMSFVLFPDSLGGLPTGELTIAEILRPRGYATHMVGKWHLGHLPRHLPTRHGFDGYFGIPYSNDMSLQTNPVYEEIFREVGRTRNTAAALARYKDHPGIELMHDEKVIQIEPDQTTLTPRYTADAISFMRRSVAARKPFFLYFAHTFPHIPLAASAGFRGKSRRGVYGDAVEEVDWSVGEVLKTLAELKIDENTLVFFSSDNGGASELGQHGGSNGPLRGGKNTTFEGGLREPFIARWKGRIPAGRVRFDVASTLDIFPTLARLTGGLPAGERVLDGADLAPLLWEGGARPQPDFFYYNGGRLLGVRRGPWKLHLLTSPGKGQQAELYNLETDISESANLATFHPDIVEQLQEAIRRHSAGIEPVPSQK
jgi:arylsulfatase A